MKAMIAARCGACCFLGSALALIATDAAAQPAPPVESPGPASNQPDEPPGERVEPAEQPTKEPAEGPAEQPAEDQRSEGSEQVEKPARTDEGGAISIEHPEKPVPRQSTQAERRKDGAGERRAPKGSAIQHNVPGPLVLGEHAATGIVADQRPTQSASPRTPWGIEAGVGPLFAWVPDDSFNLFSDSGYWPALAVRAGISVWHTGGFDVSVSGAYHYAATNGAVRQAPTKLTLHRFLFGGQARFPLLSWLAPCGRLLAGFSYLTSELGSGRENEVSTLSSIEFSALASAGLQARIIEAKRSGLSVQLYVEGGAIFSSNTELVYQMGSGAPPRSQPVDAGTLSLTGPQVETGVLALF